MKRRRYVLGAPALVGQELEVMKFTLCGRDGDEWYILAPVQEKPKQYTFAEIRKFPGKVFRSVWSGRKWQPVAGYGVVPIFSLDEIDSLWEEVNL